MTFIISYRGQFRIILVKETVCNLQRVLQTVNLTILFMFDYSVLSLLFDYLNHVLKVRSFVPFFSFYGYDL